MAWRPYCSTCGGERIVVETDPRPAAVERALCQDCGRPYEGAALSAAEARLRPPLPARASGDGSGKTLLRAC